jgi:KDO2-lipid IV(A) lauroyltransferase
MRKKSGMNIVPASISAFRRVVKHLTQGGMVLTGMDRPIPDPKYCPLFFGYPASLPTHYVSLALQAHMPVVIMAAIRQENGEYHVLTSQLIEMERHPDHKVEILRNAETSLKRAEDFIRQAPEQWHVPLPVWPSLLERMPI